ncbi:MAG: hypothetical protein ACJAYE_002580 [Candidatus Azotimanducaceae bacterium]|jgi:hypothetical protein
MGRVEPNDMKIVYRAADIIEAEIVKGMLVANDLEAHVSGFYLQGGVGEIAPTDLANVLVPDEDYDSAKELVLEYDGNQSPQNNDSLNVETIGTGPTSKMLATVVVIVAISVFGYWLVLLNGP